MPYPPQVYSLDGHAFGLTVSGVQVIDDVPTDVTPIRWDAPSHGNDGSISFTLEYVPSYGVPAGAVIRLTDNTENELLWQGVVTSKRVRRHVAAYVDIDVDGVGWGYFLANRYVPSYSWTGATPRLVLESFLTQYGGPIGGGTAYMKSGGYANASTATASTVRGVLDAVIEATTTYGAYYVDDTAALHYYYANETDAVGTAASIGTGGSVVPEFLVVDYGYDQSKHMTYAQGTATYAAYVGNTYADAWESGQTISAYVSQWSDLDSIVPQMAQDYMRFNESDITTLGFSTTEQGGWKPGQELNLIDSALGTATFTIASVSGSIDHRNVIEYQVSTANHRSIVQTVIQK